MIHQFLFWSTIKETSNLNDYSDKESKKNHDDLFTWFKYFQYNF